MIKTADIQDAYRVLGVQQGASIDVVRSAYKQIALKAHPDKNPNNPHATEEFQRVSAAYDLLVNHDSNHFTDDDDEYFDEDYLSDDEFDRMFFYFSLFEHIMHGRDHYPYSRYRREQAAPESPKATAQRARRSREEQIAAEERRKAEQEARRIRKQQEREQEQAEAEERKKAQIQEKKDKIAASRAKAEKAVKDQQRKSQNTRSSVFAAAREGNAEKVRKGVYEDDVDAVGGEIKKGCDAFVKSLPSDPQETLLHIAARQGDCQLVEWLDAHNADVEERDSEGLTAFHAAVQSGHISLVTWFFEKYPPTENDSQKIYDSPSKSILGFAVESGEPEIVWMVLDKGLASAEDLNQTWAWVTSAAGTDVMQRKKGHKIPEQEEKVEDIFKLLMRFGGFSPPSTPNLNQTCQQPSHSKFLSSQQASQNQPRNSTQKHAPSRGRGKKGGKGRS